jgi:hypothetical protein
MSETVADNKHFDNKYDNADLQADRTTKDLAAAYTQFDEMRAYKMYLETLELEAKIIKSNDVVKSRMVKPDGTIDEKAIKIADLISEQSEHDHLDPSRHVIHAGLSVVDRVGAGVNAGVDANRHVFDARGSALCPDLSIVDRGGAGVNTVVIGVNTVVVGVNAGVDASGIVVDAGRPGCHAGRVEHCWRDSVQPASVLSRNASRQWNVRSRLLRPAAARRPVRTVLRRC